MQGCPFIIGKIYLDREGDAYTFKGMDGDKAWFVRVDTGIEVKRKADGSVGLTLRRNGPQIAALGDIVASGE